MRDSPGTGCSAASTARVRVLRVPAGPRAEPCMPRLLLLCMLAGTHECARSCVLSCSSSCATLAASTLWQAKLAAWGIACRQVQKIQVETKTPQLTTALAAIQSSTDAAGQVRGFSSLCAPSCMLCVLWSTIHALPTVCGRAHCCAFVHRTQHVSMGIHIGAHFGAIASFLSWNTGSVR